MTKAIHLYINYVWNHTLRKESTPSTINMFLYTWITIIYGDNNHNKKIFSVNFFNKQRIPITIENWIDDRHTINRLLFSSRFRTLILFIYILLITLRNRNIITNYICNLLQTWDFIFHPPLEVGFDSVGLLMPIAVLVLSVEVDLSGGGNVTGVLQVLLCALSPGSSTTNEG